MAMSESQKVARYEALSPGTGLPAEQRAERYDRIEIKQKYPDGNRRRGRALVGSITIPGNADIWCTCGRLRQHDGDC